MTSSRAGRSCRRAGTRAKGSVGVLALLIALVTLPARAEIRSAELRVNGLTCPFCVFGIEKKLRKVDGVREVEVLLDEGRIRLAFAAENTATVTALERAVDDAGFELARLRLTVRGRLAREEDAEVLEVAPGMRFRLVGAETGGDQPMSPGTRGRLEAAANAGTVLIDGEVRDREAPLPSLSVERVEAASTEGP